MTTQKFRNAVFPSKYYQGPGALAMLPGWIGKMGTKALLIAGKTAMRDIVPGLAGQLKDPVVEPFGGECTDAEIGRLTAVARKAGCDVVVALGGGKVIDTAKAVSHELACRVIIVPTIASNDAPCSAVSVVYTPEGAYHHTVYLRQNPDLVLMDSEIIAQAPVRTLIAGIGDALATRFEAEACFATESLNEAGGLGTQSALALARLCYDTIVEFGSAACDDCRARRVTPALERIIEANTLLSGLGFESAGLASAHSIHNGLTQLPGTHAYFHGEKVAFGVLAGLFLADQPESLKQEVYSFCQAVGLPVTLAQIGIDQPTDDDLMRVANAACAPQEFIWHEPVAVTPEKVVLAIREADARGRAIRP